MTSETKKPPRAWGRLLTASLSAAAAGVALSIFWHAGAIGLLVLMLALGWTAGWIARRTGWLAGLIVGLPVGLMHLSYPAMKEAGSLSLLLSMPDYWRFLFPAAIVSTGMAIMGGIIGAWLHDMRLQREK